MELQTRVPYSKSASQVTYDSRLLLLGSCFVTNMGERLQYFKFNALENPFGILYQPHAIANIIKRSVEDMPFETSEFIERNEAWHSFEVHSEMSGSSAAVLLNSLNMALLATQTALVKCSHILITLGTAWVYRNKTSGALVANCHKIPQSEFSKELCSIDALQKSLREITHDIRSFNAKAQIIFTISPVRHLKDGFIGNQRSKARLIGALHDFLEVCQDDGLHYFPAYEIMMDELRDYRFYDKDLLHPNSLAADYIWEAFRKCWIAAEAYPVMGEVEDIMKGLHHRPFNAESKAFREFRSALETKIATLQRKHPSITFNT